LAAPRLPTPDLSRPEFHGLFQKKTPPDGLAPGNSQNGPAHRSGVPFFGKQDEFHTLVTHTFDAKQTLATDAVKQTQSSAGRQAQHFCGMPRFLAFHAKRGLPLFRGKIKKHVRT
jgi:hypothetical protein